jgi:tRNA (mo5U34)-methyltransferase
MERRGAAEVVAIDLDDPRRLDWPQPSPELESSSDDLAARERGFSVAHDALASSVERRDVSVYDLDPDEVGEFDFAVIGTLLLHLRDPVGALSAVRRVLRGELIVNEAISLQLTLMSPRKPRAALLARGAPFWWIPNLAALKRAVRAAGYDVRLVGRPYLLPAGAAGPPFKVSLFSDFGPPFLDLLISPRGIPTACLLARPAS